MRCVDCLPLIEEFFDGETDERTAVQIGAHLSSCADCAAALDALSFEQEIYARYDRRLEVSPSLWSAVSAEIARAPEAEPGATRRNFPSRLREGFAATLAAFTLRPALVSTLALLVVGVAVGSLWLARKPASDKEKFVAVNKHEGIGVATPSPVEPVVTVAPDEGDNGGGGVNPDINVAGLGSNAESGGKRTSTSEPSNPSKVVPAPDDPLKAIDYKPQLSALTKDTVNIPADDNAAAGNPVEIADVNFRRPEAAESAPLLDPAQKELARHVEQAQMLLRSIKNARTSDDGTVNVAYEKKLSRRLLAENATLQLDAETRGDRDGKQVLDRIEPFLLDIANMGDNPSREEVRSVRERMKKNEIIASLQVY